MAARLVPLLKFVVPVHLTIFLFKKNAWEDVPSQLFQLLISEISAIAHLAPMVAWNVVKIYVLIAKRVWFFLILAVWAVYLKDSIIIDNFNISKLASQIAWYVMVLNVLVAIQITT